MKKLFALILVLLPASLVAAPVDDLVQLLKGMKSVSGTFSQTVLDHGGTRLQEAHGDMVLARGNRFYWHTKDPYEQMAISDGKTLWVYDIDLEQVVEKPMGQKVANTPALLFGGDPASIAKVFSVEESDVSGDNITYRLRPKEEDPLFEVLEVAFAGKVPKSMRLEDALGQQTVIDFRDVRLNEKVAASRFHFDAPEGVDVIRQQE